MEFERLLDIVRDEPAFESGLLLAGGARPADVQRQLSRWTAAGRLYQLRRGLYSLAPPYQRTRPHPFLIANRMVRGSYVSLQSALAHYGLIPEYAPLTTSVTTLRPQLHHTPLGAFDYRHVNPALFFGYRRMDLGQAQHAFVALPEKALLDLIYLTPGGDAPACLRELRLQNLDRLDVALLRDFADRAGKPKLRRAVETVAELASAEAEEYADL
jgi:predicted transcriptional regulator of viral defense system